jgi:hypothetical protein
MLGIEPVRAYPIAPPREVRRERVIAEVVGRVWISLVGC